MGGLRGSPCSVFVFGFWAGRIRDRGGLGAGNAVERCRLTGAVRHGGPSWVIMGPACGGELPAGPRPAAGGISGARRCWPKSLIIPCNRITPSPALFPALSPALSPSYILLDC